MIKNKLVSYCLFTYNQEKFIQKAVYAALCQTYSPLEIIISDDSSSDSTFNIIEEIVKNYSGPHKIILNKNNRNLGIGGNFSKMCYTLAKGDYLIISAGDDISKKNHVSEAVKAIEDYPDAQMVDFSGDIIDENGKFVKKIDLDYQKKENTLQQYLNLEKIELFAPGRIVRKELLNNFEPLTQKCPTEDSVLALRSLLMGGFIRVNKNLVFYRKHSSNISSIGGLAKLSNLSITAQYMKDVLYLFDTSIIDEKLTKLLLVRIRLEQKIRNLNFGNRKFKIQNLTRPFIKRAIKLIYKLIIKTKI